MNALKTDGVLVVRKLFDSKDIEALSENVSRCYASIERGAGTEIALKAVTDWGGIPLCNSPIPFDLDWIEKIVSTLIPGARLVPSLVVFRRHTKQATYIPWHIDADGAGTGPWEPCVNVWVPFVEVGKTLPGLQFVMGSHRFMRKLPHLPAENASRPDEWVSERFNDYRRFTPELNVGDVTLFDHYMLHRTQPMAHAGVRTSAEFRFTIQR